MEKAYDLSAQISMVIPAANADEACDKLWDILTDIGAHIVYICE